MAEKEESSTRNASGYFHWPPIWIGALPEQAEDFRRSDDVVHQVTFQGGIAAKAMRSGWFMFDFSGWPSGRAIPTAAPFGAKADVILRRLEVLNSHLACLYTAVFQRQDHFVLSRMSLSPGDLIYADSLELKLRGTPNPLIGELMAFGNVPSTYRSPLEMDWRMSSRVSISDDALLYSFKLLRTILEHPQQERVLILTDLYNRSAKMHEDYDYGASLLTAWAIIEALLSEMWKRYIKSNRERVVDGAPVLFINSNRKKTLTPGRDMTASIISEALSLLDVLPFPLYQAISTTRQARNDWIHKLETVSFQTATTAVQTAQVMLQVVETVELEIPLVAKLHW